MTGQRSEGVAHAAEAYRAKVRASGDRAEWAAIDGMPDEFVAAVAREDRETMDRVARAEQNGHGHTFGPGFGGSR